MDEIECPYCGFFNDTKYMDLWELHDEESCVAECDKCGKEFEVVAHATYEYTSHKKEKEAE